MICKKISAKSAIPIIFIIIFLIYFSKNGIAQNVIIAVIDGARYSETFGAGATYIPKMWNEMRPLGTIYTQFYNYGETATVPGHSAIATGTWQVIANDGTEIPDKPIVFEYYRKQLGIEESKNYVVAGKAKLHAISYSSYTGYGISYKAAILTVNTDDETTFNNLIDVMDTYHPRIIIVNFADVDLAGHSNIWNNYIAAITKADDLISELWSKIQTDAFYQNNTTLFVTNDHGRHNNRPDLPHDGFKEHGDNCDGCQHIMLLAIGRNVSPNQVISETHTQRDIAPTTGDLLGFTTPFADGTSLLLGDQSLPVSLSSFKAFAGNHFIRLEWMVQSEINNVGFIIERKNPFSTNFMEIASYQNSPELKGRGNSSKPKKYSFVEGSLQKNQTYTYRLIDVDLHGKKSYYGPVEVSLDEGGSLPEEYILFQNYPNPFNSNTTISFQLPAVPNNPGLVVFRVFDVNGKVVRNLYSGPAIEGKHFLYWNGRSDFNLTLPSGYYWGILNYGEAQKFVRMILLK